MAKKNRQLERVQRWAEKLKALPHLSEHERVLYAWSLAATPQERWDRGEAWRRSVLSARPYEKKKSASSSSE